MTINRVVGWGCCLGAIFLFFGCTPQESVGPEVQPVSETPAAESVVVKAVEHASPVVQVFPESKEQRFIDWNKPYLVVEPETIREIQGVSKVERKRYFCVADGGVGFDKRVKDEAMYDYLVNDLGIYFGRSLGLVKYPATKLKEDPKKPGFADFSPLMKGKPQDGSEQMKADFGDNLDVAMHGSHNAYPEYMGRHETADSTRDPNHSQYIPENIDAAAMLAAAVLKFNYTDFTRPRYYELVNEPHWSFFNDQHLADWHLKTKAMVQRATPDVKVGGLCMSVCYFYRNNYKGFNGLRQFIDNTKGDMDFYSFHVYDYLRWRDGEYKGRMQSGLPLEGTLDLVPNYTMNTFGHETGMVISEQGGYNGEAPKGEFDGEWVAAGILSNAYPNADHDSWDIELKKRSIVSFGHVSSIIANTLAFIDHPHTVQKAVPFILGTTWNWGPNYYAQLYVAKDYTDESEWVEQDTLNFYKFFRGLDGHRVKALCSDPDLQTRAFTDGKKLYLAINNQSFKSESIDLYGIEAGAIDVRRLGRNEDFTMSYTEKTIVTPDVLNVAGREAVMIVADLPDGYQPKQKVNEVICYGDKVAVPMAEAEFEVNVPSLGNIDYAQLRVAVTRSPGLSMEPIITLNGKPLTVPLEDSAERYVDREYASTKLIYVNPIDLKPSNVVKVSFPDGDDGAVGSVVIRAAVRK